MSTKADNNKKEKFKTFRITDEMDKALQAHSKISELTYDAILRVAVKKYLKELGYIK